MLVPTPTGLASKHLPIYFETNLHISVWEGEREARMFLCGLLDHRFSRHLFIQINHSHFKKCHLSRDFLGDNLCSNKH